MSAYPPPQATKVLILSPHPDDESLGCAGTILMHTQTGTDVRLAVLSKGDKLEKQGSDNIAEIRRSETLSAARIMGIKHTYFLEFPDEKLADHKEQIREALTEIINEISPDLIYSPSPFDPHPDHRATSDIVLALMKNLRGFRVAFYEIYHPARWNVLVDISSVIDMKKDAILTYKKSLLDMPETVWQSIEGLNLFRSFPAKKNGFYEAFWLIDHPVPESEIIKWGTFDHEYDAAAEFLSKLRVADQLIYELQRAQGEMEKKDAEATILRKEISHLQADFAALQERLLAKEEESRVLRNNLDLLTSSFFWKAIERFHRFRDRLLPDGTKRRNFYNKLMTNLKNAK